VGVAIVQSLQLAPQCWLSCVWHVPPHSTLPVAQIVITQIPPLHICPAPHAWPHEPQLALSLAVGMQVPPQFIWPAGHTHTPPVHVAVAGHAEQVAPQLVTLNGTHAPPLRHCPAGQPQRPPVQTMPDAHA
jgi:hypothetical protein